METENQGYSLNFLPWKTRRKHYQETCYQSQAMIQKYRNVYIFLQLHISLVRCTRAIKQPRFCDWLLIVLTCNVKSLAHSFIGFITTTFNHCPISSSCGSDCQSDGEVCYSCWVTRIRNIASEGKLEATNNPLLKWAGGKIININDLWNKPSDDSSAKCCASVGHHFPRTGSLSPIQSRCQCHSSSTLHGWYDYNQIPYHETFVFLVYIKSAFCLKVKPGIFTCVINMLSKQHQGSTCGKFLACLQVALISNIQSYIAYFTWSCWHLHCLQLTICK